MYAAAEPLRVGMLVGSTIQSHGVIEIVRSLASALEKRGNIAVEIFSLEHEDGESVDLGAIPIHVAPTLGPRSFRFAPDLVNMMHQRNLDCVHVHGMWNYLSVAARRWHQMARRPYIVSPHGMIDRWALANTTIRKRVVRMLFEDAHIRDAAVVHAVSATEHESVRLAGYATPTDVIPNGVEPAEMAGPAAPWLEALGPDARVLLFLGKITPSRGLASLLRAWYLAGDAEGGEGWHLVIVGPSSPDHLAELRALTTELGIAQTVHFVGPAFGSDRGAAYRSADAFVLPSLSETLPMTALEAFAFELPSLLTPQCNIPEAFARGAAIRVEPNEESLAKGLARLFAMTPMDRSRMGRAAYDLADSRYDWDLAASRFESLYATVLAQSRGIQAA